MKEIEKILKQFSNAPDSIIESDESIIKEFKPFHPLNIPFGILFIELGIVNSEILKNL